MRTAIKNRPISPDNVRVGLISYSDSVKLEFSLGQYDSQTSVNEGIENLQLGQRGRRPALALEYFLDNLDEIGRRPQNPLVLILLTNGRSTEDRLKLMLTGWKVQAEAWCNSYAIGIGPNADEEEMFLIGGDLQHYQMLPEGSSKDKISSRIINQTS